MIYSALHTNSGLACVTTVLFQILMPTPNTKYFFFAVFIGSIFLIVGDFIFLFFFVLSVADGGGCHGTNYYKLLAGVVIFSFWFHSIIFFLIIVQL